MRGISILRRSYLRKGSPGPKLEIAAFDKWCKYTYENTKKDSPFRKLMFQFFYYALTFTTLHLGEMKIHMPFNTASGNLSCLPANSQN